MTHQAEQLHRRRAGSAPAPARTFDRRNPAQIDEVVAHRSRLRRHRRGRRPSSTSPSTATSGPTLAPDVRADVLIRAATILARASATTLVEELVREEGKTLAEATMEVRRTPQNLRFYAGEALRLDRRDLPDRRRQPGLHRARARSAWSPRSRRGTSRSTSPPASSGRRWPPATGWCSSRARSPRCSASGWSRRCSRPGCPAARSRWSTATRRSVAHWSVDTRVDAVTFTGSTAVGEAIHRPCPPRSRVQLEMGGKNALVVCEDADLDKAADIIAKGAFGLSGQACTGTSRVVVARARP